MQVENTNPLPTLNREIFVHEKKMKTLQSLEKSILSLGLELKAINVECPFGSDSVEVQNAVNIAQTWCTNFNTFLVEVNNHTMWQHSKAMKVLAENEHVIDPSEAVEDLVASLKSTVTEELEASRIVREYDIKRQRAFDKKLKSLENEFFGLDHLSNKNLNRGNDHYPIVE